MIWMDWVIVGIIILSALISLMRGFVKEFMSLVIWLAAFMVASHFYQSLAVYLTEIDDPLFKNGTAIAILFVATLILGAIVNFILGQLVSKTGLSGTDRVLGICFGALRGTLIVSAVLFFLDTFTPASQSAWWANSLLVSEFEIIIQWFFVFMQHQSSFLA